MCLCAGFRGLGRPGHRQSVCRASDHPSTRHPLRVCVYSSTVSHCVAFLRCRAKRSKESKPHRTTGVLGRSAQWHDESVLDVAPAVLSCAHASGGAREATMADGAGGASRPFPFSFMHAKDPQRSTHKLSALSLTRLTHVRRAKYNVPRSRIRPRNHLIYAVVCLTVRRLLIVCETNHWRPIETGPRVETLATHHPLPM